MGHPRLQRTLRQLRGFGAQGLPSEEQVIKAPDGHYWKGRAGRNRTWGLRKNHEASFNFETNIYHAQDPEYGA
ncbi:MAG TPA: hypothetical protein VIT68_04200 [Candidatus Gracilibacteria bacterium]